MTKEEFEAAKDACEDPNSYRFEVLKALWRIAKALETYGE